MSGTCYRVDLSDGYFVMRYVYRRRVVRLERLQRIEFIPSDGDGGKAMFDVALDDASHFRVAANESSRRMMEQIVERRPEVRMIGNIRPPKLSRLPRTRRDDEFWSRRGRRAR